MTALTAQQRSNLKADVGDDTYAFTNEEIDAIWGRLNDPSYSASTHDAALYLMWRQIAAKAAAGYDQKTGLTEDKFSQIFPHAQAMMKLYETAYNAVTNQKQQVVLATVRPIENQNREYPNEPDSTYRRRRNC